MGNNRAFEILDENTKEYMSKVRLLEAMKQYAKECVKASLERAYNNATDKQSILNEDNIVLV